MVGAPILYMITTVVFAVVVGDLLALPSWAIFALAIVGTLTLELIDPFGIDATRGGHV